MPVALTDRHYSLVRLVARDFPNMPRAMDGEDLIQDGMVGLLESAMSYRPGAVGFETFAYHRIRGAMLDAMRRMDWATRDQRAMRKRIAAAIAELSTELGREPEPEEIAARLGISHVEWEAIRAEHAVDPGTIREYVPTTTDQPENDYWTLRRLMRAVVSLRPSERRLIVARYVHGVSMRVYATFARVSESRGWKIHRAALDRLRKAINL